jgi:hypothetical protein
MMGLIIRLLGGGAGKRRGSLRAIDGSGDALGLPRRQ